MYAHQAELLAERGDLYGASTRECIEGGAGQSAADYAEARNQLVLARKAVAAVFKDVDSWSRRPWRGSPSASRRR